MEHHLDMAFSNDQPSVLKEYYARYLSDIRGVSDSSVRHYFDALNNISRRLKAKGLVQRDIYEVSDLEQLARMRDILYSDPDFVDMNERGRRMYSAGLNNYFRFAEGEGFRDIRNQVVILDVPVAPEAAIIVEHATWKRSGILRTQAIEMAGYSCEINADHQTFIAAHNRKPYMEGHHALPMNQQPNFNVSLDVYANIICLCPTCHRRIHHGLKEDRVDMAKQLFDARIPRLANCGIHIDEAQFVEVAAGL